jgi:hypothetical protein
MLTSLMFLGELTEVSRACPQLLAAALEQGNLIAATDLRTRLNPIWLAADDPDRARDEVISAMSAWPREGFHLQHYTSLAALAQIELYTGDTEVAWKHIESQVKPLEKSLVAADAGSQNRCVPPARSTCPRQRYRRRPRAPAKDRRSLGDCYCQRKYGLGESACCFDSRGPRLPTQRHCEIDRAHA